MDHNRKAERALIETRVRSIEHFIWVCMPEFSVKSAIKKDRVTFYVKSETWKTRASFYIEPLLALDYFDPEAVAEALITKMKKAMCS